MIPNAAIEAARNALHDRDCGGVCDSFTMGKFQQQARAAIEAAMPAIREAIADELHDQRLAQVGRPKTEWQNAYSEGMHQAEYIVRGDA